MRMNSDFAQLYRSSIGFDRIFALLDNATRVQSDNWPPYDIEKTAEDGYRISMAVAGFTEGELNITTQQNLLMVTGEKASGPIGEYLHHGIANRPFTRQFELADHVKVAGAHLANGLLTIDLKREVPEEMKPRRIEIRPASTLTKAAPRQIEADQKQAA